MEPGAPFFLMLVLAAAALGCGGVADDLTRAESAYDQAQYDTAEVWLLDLDRSVASMDVGQRARYFYVRGMTSYRLGQRDDALHFLALAREEAGNEQASALPEQQRRTMERALTELTPTEAASFHAREATAENASGEESPASN